MVLHFIHEICFIEPGMADIGMPEWANLVGRPALGCPKNGGELLGGGGIYACFWDGELIYIGSFIGPEGNLSGEHVAQRIYKHVIGFTLRAQQLGFEKGPLRSIIANLDSPIASDLAAARRINARLEGGAIKASYNKARFAARHWDVLRDASPETLLSHFSFGYFRILSKIPPAMKQEIKTTWFRPIEKSLVRQFWSRSAIPNSGPVLMGMPFATKKWPKRSNRLSRVACVRWARPLRWKRWVLSRTTKPTMTKTLTTCK